MRGGLELRTYLLYLLTIIKQKPNDLISSILLLLLGKKRKKKNQQIRESIQSKSHKADFKPTWLRNGKGFFFSLLKRSPRYPSPVDAFLNSSTTFSLWPWSKSVARIVQPNFFFLSSTHEIKLLSILCVCYRLSHFTPLTRYLISQLSYLTLTGPDSTLRSGGLPSGFT